MTAERRNAADAGTRADTRMMLLLHRALRCDLERLVAALDAVPEGDRRRARDLARWYRELARQIHGHHRAEDEVLIPKLAARSEELAAGAGPQMVDDHRYVTSLTDRVADRLHRLAGGEPWPDAWRAARADAAALASLAADHFAHEEREVVPLFARYFTAAEYDALSRQVDRLHSATDLSFALPWFFDHLEPAERAEILADMRAPLRLLARAFRPRYRRLVRAAGLPSRATTRVDTGHPFVKRRSPAPISPHPDRP